jgi:hypothetical protein
MSDDAAAIRAEWRADEEQWSRAAFEQWEHGRGLADIARDCMHRGDIVTFAFASASGLQSWTGVLVATGHDVARVDTGDVRVDVRLAVDAPFVLRVRPGTRAASSERGRDDAGLTTFTARLRELDGTTMGIGTPTGALEGRLRTGRDQLRVTGPDDVVAYVPTGSVWWVRPLDDD